VPARTVYNPAIINVHAAVSDNGITLDQEECPTMTRRVTIADVAREAGVSLQTVSRVLNNKGEIRPETRSHILAIIERLGYRPNALARGLATHKTFALGLVMPDIANPFFSAIARGAEEAARQAGYSLLLFNTIEDPAREVEALGTLAAQRVDGLLLCSSRLPDDELRRRLSELPATVLVNRELTEPALSVIRVDNEAEARCAVEFLLSRARRTIAFLAGPVASHGGSLRALGYRRALEAAGIACDPTLVRPCIPHLDGGRSAAHALLSARPDVDAVLCYNDLVAVGALQACAEMGRRVPEDVAVVGCDDIMLAALVTPPLTTMRSDQRRMGDEGIGMLLRAINQPEAGPEKIILQPELVVRASA